ncbi:CBS domain-containing protein [Corynebacterium sp. TAE3-ERU12]|uniref:CBS domain-containing protein n=1 Tax=Corynebacterium sp. TAE3-ERU12 TaxID=2849491 RepID=UPI001C476740|nr:CBS domain-containing protein [Corynebacterium sp. TAE3-ERU12]MBV7295368.1 CBS domain-containing protein [Corynebacterium sp. TAE3-ERU12]
MSTNQPASEPTETETAGTRATEFLSAFNRLEKHFRAQLNLDRYIGFTSMVHKLHKRGELSDAQHAALTSFAELRNAISHGEYHQGMPIADPLPHTVAAIHQIEEVLIHPPQALRVLEHRRPVTVRPEDSVDSIYDVLRTTTYSQFPVYTDGTCTALLTTDQIARWLAEDITDDGHISARTVAEILDTTGTAEKPVFVRRTVTVQEAVQLLTVPTKKGRLPRALVVTEHGHADQKPLRVIGGGDLPALLESVAVPD